ncbi:MAG: hypothetical protein ACKV2U_26445 [Bryobacteraceae bacterium]
MLDPWDKKAFAYDGTATTEVHDKLSVAGFDVNLSEIFSKQQSPGQER